MINTEYQIRTILEKYKLIDRYRTITTFDDFSLFEIDINNISINTLSNIQNDLLDFDISISGNYSYGIILDFKYKKVEIL